MGRAARAAALAAVVLLLLPRLPAVVQARADAVLPERLSDKAFWSLIAELSEPDGYFQSDNLVSNERPFQEVVPALRQLRRGGVYLGVAPDQNFTYIAALEPRLAFILDIRRGNLLEHLMYKAVFELSADRADFVSRLFSRRRPAGLTAGSTAAELFEAFSRVAPDEELFKKQGREIERHLRRVHGFALSAEDAASMQSIYHAFFQYGPALTYASSRGRGGRNMPTFAELQTATDAEGVPRAFLATEENYLAVKRLQDNNLVVPIVGDFAGPTALRAIGRYVADRGATITAYYTSNVEQYLFQHQVWQAFSQNVATLPIDEASVFIRSARGQSVIDPIGVLLRDAAEGRIDTYESLTSRGTMR